MISLDGKRLSFTSKTRQEASAWIKKTVAQVDAGLTYQSSRSTLTDYLGSWLVSIKTTVRPGTWYQYEMSCRNYILPRLGRIKLKDLNPGHLQALYNAQIEVGKGVRTIKVVHVVLHKSLKQAVKLGMIGKNPADVVDPPKYQHEEMKIYNDTQVNQMLFTARGDRNETLFNLAVTTGCRQSELLALKWSDLDWQNRTLHIQRQLRRNNRSSGSSENKSSKSHD
jgi:integrase